jgi:hypothetical protein
VTVSVRGQERGLIHTKRPNTVGAGRVVDMIVAQLVPNSRATEATE